MHFEKFKIARGKPVFGATVDPAGTNFAIFSRNASKVYLEIYKEFYDGIPVFKYELDPVTNKTGDVWHVYIYGIGDRAYYGWRVDGPYSPEEGHRYNINKLIVDPYAKALSGTYDFGNTTIYSYDKNGSTNEDLSFSRADSAQLTCKSIVVDDAKYNWMQDLHPRISMRDTIIYEMHVRLFTMNQNSGVEKRGTFEGLTEKVNHLKELGITAIELLPVFEFNVNSVINRNPETGELLEDVWGYNPLGFFAVTGNYTYGLRLGEQVFQFKDFIKFMHKNGLEVILDVVYNHTGEGNEYGPTISFKGIDNSVYYILEKNKRYYSNYSGTGNTLNCSHTVVKEMVLDSLRYWVTEMHVDGFRFDLAAILGRDSTGKWIGDLSLLKEIADDPILAGSKLIAEGWDAAGGYFVGEFPVGWAEWNGKFRDTARKFIKGDNGAVADLATRICGSPDLFWKFGRKPYHSINFITAHDGFTMWDLVSYNNKHNYANGEENRDGMDDNTSYNHGVEGETDNVGIINLRKRQVKNLCVLLMISQGIPMILMGDEFGRTQHGNNNAYCQDSELSWVDWQRGEEFADIHRFFKKMIQFRKEHSSLRREHFFVGKDFSGDGKIDIVWHGTKVNKPDWSEWSHSLAFEISGIDKIEASKEKCDDIYVALNAYWKPLRFELPKKRGKKWYRVVDTFLGDNADFIDEPVEVSGSYLVMDRSSVILIAK